MYGDTADASITVMSSSEAIYYTLYLLCLLQDQQHEMGSGSGRAQACVVVIFALYCVGVSSPLGFCSNV